MSLQTDASLRSDLDYLKKLAGEGRGRPAPMAALVAGFGLLYGAGSLYNWWAIRTYAANIRDTAGLYYVAPLWWTIHSLFAALLLACLIQAILRRGEAGQINRFAAAGWTAAFIGLVAAIASALLQGQAANNFLALDLLPSFLLILWGFGWFVSAAATGRKWLYVLAGASFLAAPLWAVTALFSINGLLVAALCLLLLAFVPGAILMRRA